MSARGNRASHSAYRLSRASKEGRTAERSNKDPTVSSSLHNLNSTEVLQQFVLHSDRADTTAVETLSAIVTQYLGQHRGKDETELFEVSFRRYILSHVQYNDPKYLRRTINSLCLITYWSTLHTLVYLTSSTITSPASESNITTPLLNDTVAN